MRSVGRGGAHARLRAHGPPLLCEAATRPCPPGGASRGQACGERAEEEGSTATLRIDAPDDRGVSSGTGSGGPMFVRKPTLDSLVVSSGDILLLLISLNRPMVALEDFATDEADATICTVQRESDMVSTVVHLLLQQGRTALFFTFESDPYPVDLRGPVEEEAIDFVESLGFVMDDARFSQIGPDEQKALLERPIFTGALSEVPGPEPAATAFEVPPDPAFQFEPMTEERLQAMETSPGDASPVASEAPPGALGEAMAVKPVEEPLPVALPEASPQETEIVLEDVLQDSPETSAAGPALPLEPMTPSPAPQEAPAAAESPAAGSALSHFRRRSAGADLYTIHGVGAPPDLPAPAAIETTSSESALAALETTSSESAPAAIETTSSESAPAALETAPSESALAALGTAPSESALAALGTAPSESALAALGTSGRETSAAPAPGVEPGRAPEVPVTAPTATGARPSEDAAVDPDTRRRRARARYLASF